MKKLFLILVMTATAATVFAQSQLSTVRGKTKDGKSIKVEYYQGTVEDVIRSVQYQLVDELQADVKSLQSQTKALQGKVDEANNQVKKLKKQLDEAGGDSAEEQRLRNQLAEKERQVAKLNNDIEALNKQIAELQKADMSGVVASLREQLTEKDVQIAEQEHKIDSMKRIKTVVIPNNPDKQVTELRKQIAEKDATIDDLNHQLARYASKPVGGKPAKTPVIGLEVGYGPAFPGKSVSEPWAKQVKSSLQADLYFGTACLSESFPISVEVGVGFRKFGLAAILNEYNTSMDAVDADGDNYQAIYAYNDLQESLTLTYLDVPIRLCIGQPAKDRVTAYAKLGLTPSIKMSAKFEGTGKHSLKGYYPQWDVTLENVESLGFGSDMDCYDGVEPEISAFNLWGTVAFGAYVPFKGSPIVFNAGVKLDYPFLTMGSFNAVENLPMGKPGLLQNGGKVVIPSVEIGLVYTLK